MAKGRVVLFVEKQFKKDEIVRMASQLVKDCDFVNNRGMVEVSCRNMRELDKLLAQLDQYDLDLYKHD